MSNLPSITIVTPSYNQAAFLEETIRSVLDQGYPNLQYGIVDGASKDGSVEIIEKYRTRLDFAISERDRGQVDALNKGLRQATGDIFGFINSDDTLLPGSLATVGRYFAEHSECVWVMGHCVAIDQDGHRLRHVPAYPIEDLAHALLRDRPFCTPQPSIFFRRSLIEKHGLFSEELEYCFDFEMWCRWLAQGLRPHIIDSDLATYRLHQQSKTVALRHRQLWDHILIERKYGQLLPWRQRLTLQGWIGYRMRTHAALTAGSGLWSQVARRPWWLASQRIRAALWQQLKAA
ncbi:MAG: glycosyltransferase [Phycisphaeraceae bacterium]|nr:glycosyltransferase [Phycisphaeraceae bacterium]